MAVWRNYEEVFDLALDGPAIVAATNGGLVRFDGKTWRAAKSPSGIRSIVSVTPMTVQLVDGRTIKLGGKPSSATNRIRNLSQGTIVDPESPWSVTDFPTPPPAHVYALLRRGKNLFAGTSAGLFRGDAGAWTKVRLPSPSPVSRPNGIAQINGRLVVGGLGGLFVSQPSGWRLAREDPIRQIATSGQGVWVVHGSGALDRVEPSTDRLFPDVLSGSSKRPWTSCIGFDGSQPLFGGQGGWVEFTQPLGERYPEELKGDVVTAIVGNNSVRWVGTQKSGLVRFGPSEVRQWNPGNGLTDTWVTALCHTPKGLFVGTAHRGVFLLVGDRIAKIPCPTERVTAIAQWKTRIVVGGMDGVWIQNGTAWTALATNQEETTSVVALRDQLAVTTASGIFFFK